jgi:peptidoglycan/LPS O-acetylase OafA/YrhL
MLFRSVFVLIIVYFSIFKSQLFIISKNFSKFLGGMSYFIYLIHFPVFFILNNYFEFNFFLYFFFSIIFSGIFFYIYDSLIKNFKNEVRGRPL